MPAIRSHSTATNDGAWDGPKMRARLRNDGSESYYRSAFAWQDPDGDPKVKASYKFIHHMVSESGEVGAANLTACSAGIAVLNGGRGGSNIPDTDRRGVWNHLARHLRDADREPPELKDEEYEEMKSQLVSQFQIKELDENGTFEGHAAVFNNIDLQGDRIKRGAFADTIAESGGRWPILMGHLASRIVGFSTGAEEDSKGLRVRGEFTMDADEGRNAYATARHAARVKQPLGLSIGYMVAKDGSKFDADSGIRTLSALNVLEFSLAAVPANPRARIDRIKGLENIRQVEATLKEAGFTGDEARIIISICKGERDANLSTSERDAKGGDQAAEQFLAEWRSANLYRQMKGVDVCLKV